MIDREYLENGIADFDFRRPNCPAAPAGSPLDLEVRYLGSGGIYIAWRDDALLLGPYFSNPGSLFTAQLGRLRFDEPRIARGMRDLDKSRIRAIATGHSHFDHLGDVPVLLRDYVRKATVYVNRDGEQMLAAYGDELKPRVVAVDAFVGEWITVPREDGSPSLFRIMPVRWDHAPPVCRYGRWPCTYANCRVQHPWTSPWTDRPMKKLCGGDTFAYVIDLLGTNGEVRFRLYYNDAAASDRAALPPAHLRAERAFDLAVICMASYEHAHRYPEALLQALQPAHILISHYEDFFVKSSGSWRFVPLMSNAKADRFMRRLKDTMQSCPTPPQKPTGTVCGPMTSRWSMPVPHWPLYFYLQSGGDS